MTQEDRDEWVAALRSGKYEQTKGVLMHADQVRACCLGVLCDLQAEKGLLTKRVEKCNVMFQDPNNKYDAQVGLLPYVLTQRFEAKTARCPVTFHGANRTLAGLNDDDVPFSVIADLIEDQVEIVPSYSF